MLKASYSPYNFHFKVPGGTSRGILTEKPSWILRLWDSSEPEIFGLGEVSIIPGLSPEPIEKLLVELDHFTDGPTVYLNSYSQKLVYFPSLQFGIETALLDLKRGGRRILFPSEFTQGEKGIRTNGLIWMGAREEMLCRIQEKLQQGFRCIKIKVGAVDFNHELELLQFIREHYTANTLEIRVDANGAFTPKEVIRKLELLARYQIHSVEQPIKQGQWAEMRGVCLKSPIPVALDEELIGIWEDPLRNELLDVIRPQYIILKPSLIGGLKKTARWSQMADQRNIGWWVTSALEGNIGLNAIAQWIFCQGSTMPQGLGTGQIYTNNFNSPLEMRGEELWYSNDKKWPDFSTLNDKT
ncbi:MAG: o-succinylbenzoate synthase [Salinivirgaceae bacterium]|nr:o-succinylbenzoate synthase [Salinivirgaceae bacterium]